MKLLNLILFSLFVVNSFQLASAQGIVGVSPANYIFSQVLRGGYAERPFTISYSSDQPVGIILTTEGEIKDWISFSANYSVVSNLIPWRPLISVQPPRDIQNGNYSGILRIETRDLGPGGKPNHATGNIIGVLDVAITVEVTDQEIVRCFAKNFDVHSAEKGEDILVTFDLLNSGNIRLKPRANVDLWDQDQISIIKSKQFTGIEVLPTREQHYIFHLSTNDLAISQYWAELSILDCLQSDFFSVDVFQPGTLHAQGIFKDLFAPPVVQVGDTVAITALFENTGEKSIPVQFRGQITQKDKIVQYYESPKQSVDIGLTSNFTMFFTPSDEGSYIISGRFFYESKRTFEITKVLMAQQTGINWKAILPYLLYIVAIVFLIIFYIRIRTQIKNFGGRL